MNIEKRIDPMGLYRWNEFKEVLPVGQTAWREMVVAKRAPQPKKLSRKCVVWSGSDILDWLSRPDTYTATVEGASQGA